MSAGTSSRRSSLDLRAAILDCWRAARDFVVLDFPRAICATVLSYRGVFMGAVFLGMGL